MQRVFRTAGWALAACLIAGSIAGCDNPNMPWAQKKPGTPPPGQFAINAFKGTVKVEWLLPIRPQDGFRDMKLLEPFGFVDAKGVHWDVPAGYVTNGASIPWGLWNIIGGPFDGPYRDAAVVHDYFTEKKQRSWEDTHKLYYEASIARGVSDTLAATMYAGLRLGGPRWQIAAGPDAARRADAGGVVFAQAATPTIAPATATPTKSDPGLTKAPPTINQKQAFDDLQKWIEREKPTLAEIDKRVEEMRRDIGMPVAPPKPK